MLRYFFEDTGNTEENIRNASLFRGLKIMESGSAYTDQMGKYPVINLTLKSAKQDTFESAFYKIKDEIAGEFKRHNTLLESEALSDTDKRLFREIMHREASYDAYSGALKFLSECLYQALKEQVIILIDEYDVPLENAYFCGFYDKMTGLISSLFESALKTNQRLKFAVISGCLPVEAPSSLGSKIPRQVSEVGFPTKLGKTSLSSQCQSIFTGLNHLNIISVMDKRYSEHFGFTEAEVREAMAYYGVEERLDDMKKWYDGYLFGGRHVYNPWSVTHYAVRKVLAPYWVNTSENSIIRDAFAKSSSSFITDYRKLIEQGNAEVEAELTTSYYEQPDDASLWGLLVNAGMITIEENLGENFYRVKIPNHEVQKAFRSLTAFYLQVQEGHISKMLRYLKTGEMEEFAEQYKRILMEVPSYHDLKCENSYHMMMLGMCAFLDLDYIVRSNLESGTGRADILLYAKRPNLPNYVLEFKYTKEESQNLKKLAEQAILQIKEKSYDAGMTGSTGYIGLAHYGKEAEIVWQ